MRLQAFTEDVSPKDILGHLLYNFSTFVNLCNILQWKLHYKSKRAVRNEIILNSNGSNFKLYILLLLVLTIFLSYRLEY